MVVVVVVLVVIMVIRSGAIMIVVVIIVLGLSLWMLVLMLVGPEMEVRVVDDLTADHVLVAEGNVLQRHRGQPGQGEQNPHRPDENGGAGADGPMEARRLS